MVWVVVADNDCVAAGLKFAGEIDVDFESVVSKLRLGIELLAAGRSYSDSLQIELLSSCCDNNFIAWSKSQFCQER